MDNSIKNAFFIKSFLSMLLPYPSIGIIEKNQVDANFLDKMFKNLNLSDL